MGKNSTASYESTNESDDTDHKFSTMIKHIIFYVLWALIFGLEFTYRQPLFDKSIQL